MAGIQENHAGTSCSAGCIELTMQDLNVSGLVAACTGAGPVPWLRRIFDEFGKGSWLLILNQFKHKL